MTLKCTILKCYKLFKTPILQKTCELAASTNILLMQPFSGVLTKGFSENMKQIYRKTPMLIAVILLIALLLILSQKKEKLYGQLRKKKKGKTDTAWDPIFQSYYTVGLSHIHYQHLIRLCLSKDI